MVFIVITNHTADNYISIKRKLVHYTFYMYMYMKRFGGFSFFIEHEMTCEIVRCSNNLVQITCNITRL